MFKHHFKQGICEQKEYLMIQVFDYDYVSVDDSSGFTIVPIAPVVSAYIKVVFVNPYHTR